MQIEPYKVPYDKSGKVSASKWIAYILRQEETGLICPTAIMIDPKFEQAIADLRIKQIDEFHRTVSPKSLEFWKTRVIPEDDPKMTAKERKTYERQRQQRNRILAQEENVNDVGPIGHIRNSVTAVKMQQLVHDLMLTQKYHLTGGVAAGKMFQHQFDKSLLTDPEAEQKIIAAMKAVRDCFPKNMPVVLSFHLDKSQNNPHIHGWFYDRLWDTDKNEWGEVSPLTSTKAGLVTFHKMVDEAVLQTTGTNFGDHQKSFDPARPKRDKFTKRQAYWTQHFRGRQDEFLKGDFLNEIKNGHEREAMRQFVEQRRYDIVKLRAAEALKQEKAEHRAELSKIRKNEKVPRMERRALYREVEEMTLLMDAAANPSREISQMHPAKPGTQSFKPVTGYYRTMQHHKRLSTSITSHYDKFSDEAKAAEIRSIRESIAKIDQQLQNTELSRTQRTNLEFTRDFEIKSLKYMKAQLPPLPPKPAQPTPRPEPTKSAPVKDSGTEQLPDISRTPKL